MRRLGTKFMVVLLTAVMIWNAILGGNFGGGKAFAANDFSGSGTLSSPYLIGTADQLNQIRGSYLNKNLYFKLTKNIDLRTSSYKDNWTPIGDKSNAPFRGNFDGNGFVISGLTIDQQSNNLGLFGNTSIESVINDIKLEDVNVTGLNSVGGLVGANKGTITNSYVTGQVTGGDHTGGLVGYNGVTILNPNAIINHSFAVVDVNGAYGTGGLTGGNTGTITYSYAMGDAKGGYAVGGLVGDNDGSISYSYATGEMLDGQSIGGLVGNNTGTINSSFATGRVNGTYSTGGLTGYNYGMISKSYSTGDVYGEQHVGGLVSNLEAAGSISDSFATGNVSGDYYVGGLIGYDYADSTGSYSNSYASGNVSGIDIVGNLSSTKMGNNIGSLYLDASMKGPVAGWDFVNLWSVDPLRNNGYPYLKDSLFQLQYDGNGNTGGTIPSDAISYLPGETASVYAGPIDLTRTGYTFSGWNTQPNGHGDSYSGSFQIMPYTILYAQWVAQSSAATLTSGIGSVSKGGTTNETITNIPYGTSLAVLKEEITPATNATFEIYDADGTTVATTLTSGKKVIVTAADGSTKVTYTVTVIASSEKDITAFSFAEQTGAATINKTAHTVVVQVTGGTDVTNLKALFTLSAEATASVVSVNQVSGTTANDFTNAVTYVVKAGDGSTQNWTVTVTKSSEKDITDFAVSGVTQTKAADISVTDHTVYVEVAYGTSLSSLSNLKATFSLSPGATAKIGSIVQVSGSTANDMRTPVKYVVTAADGSSQEWIISVYIEASSAKDIMAFSFSSQTKPATINAAAHTVAIEVKSGTNVANLVATFTLSLSSSAKVNGVSQKSGITSNNFTNPVTYVVKAENGTSQNWVVTVTVALPSSANDVTAFSFTAQSQAATINAAAHTVAIEVKNGTSLNGLKATFTLSAGAAAKVSAVTQVSGTTANDFTTPVTYVVTAEDGSIQNWTVTVTVAASSAKAITAFSLAEQTGAATINATAHTIAVEVAYGTEPNGLVATFALSLGASVAVGSVNQVSGTTANDFTNPVTYVVKAADGSTQNWTVTVTVAASSAKAITAFSLAEQTGVATINAIAHTIAIEVANGTSLNGLVATFALSPGASAVIASTNQVSGTNANDFTNPVTYVVKAADGSTQNWTVTVTVAASSAKVITAFSLAEQTGAATINATAHTIAVEVSNGTEPNGLVATFTLSPGATTAIGATNQVSGTTANDFTNPVTYVVKAADGSTQNWTVTVSVKIVLSSAATLTSTIGTVSGGVTVNETITNIPNGTTLAAFKAAITPAAKATFEVFDSDGVTTATALATGAKVIVTAEDRTTKVTYTVTVNTAPPSGGGGGPIAPTPPPSDTKVSSPDGRLTIPIGSTGEVSLDDAIIVTVPANAADKELIITIQKVTDTRELLANNEVLVTAVYEILKNFPEDFHKPVTITFTFDPASLKSNQRAAIFYYDETKKSWIEITGSQISGNHITVAVSHFTKFAVLAVSQSTDIPDPKPPVNTEPTIKLIDIAGHWAESAILQALKNGIVTGYPDGTFKPNHTVTRAEFTVMLMKALNSKESAGEAGVLAFTDAAKIGAWAKSAVAQALQAGYITGYEDGTFRPDAPITRAEMAVMVARALGLSLQTNVSTDFTDDKDIPAWAKASVAAMKKFGYMGGKGANKFDPNAMTTRAEAVSVLLKVLNN